MGSSNGLYPSGCVSVWVYDHDLGGTGLGISTIGILDTAVQLIVKTTAKNELCM
jgi:hypothetical protein